LVTNVYDLGTREEVAQGRAEGPAEEMLPLADELAVETLRSLLDATGREGAGDITPESLTTQSLAALRHFLDGERSYRRARFAEAVESFEAAVTEDSTFVLAMARLGDAYGWLEDISSEAGVDWGSRALAQADRLPARLQLYVRAADALVQGSAEVLPDLREAVQRYPDDPEGWYLLAETLIHVPGGSLASADDAANALDAALGLDPDFGPYLLHVADVAVMREDRQEAEATLARYEELSGSEGLSRAHIELAIPLVLGDSAEFVDALARAREASPRTLALLLGTYSAHTNHYDRLEPVNDILGEKVGVSRDQWTLWSMGTRGALADAEAYAARAVVPAWAKGVYVGHVATVWDVLPEDPALLAFLEPGACEGNPTCLGFVGYAQVFAEQWEGVAATGEALRAAAREYATENPDAPPGVAARFADVVEGLRLVARGEAERGRAILTEYVTDNSNPGNLARTALADLALQEGRLNDADRLYNGLLMTYGRTKGLYGKAKVAEARGNDGEALRYWRSFVTLTEAADAEGLPMLREGRAALARLEG
jgi:tetratricopeptide (TPR) repeat protein